MTLSEALTLLLAILLCLAVWGVAIAVAIGEINAARRNRRLLARPTGKTYWDGQVWR